ncbi:hypothetical protein MRY82_10630 [bacterium]|nr:hypothetical protein [bacterium]
MFNLTQAQTLDSLSLSSPEQPTKALPPSTHIISLMASPDPRIAFELELAKQTDAEEIIERMFNSENGDFSTLSPTKDLIAIYIDQKPSLLYCGASNYPTFSVMIYDALQLTEKKYTAQFLNSVEFSNDDLGESQCMQLIFDIQQWYDDREHCEYIILHGFIGLDETFPAQNNPHHPGLKQRMIHEDYNYHELKCKS